MELTKGLGAVHHAFSDEKRPFQWQNMAMPCMVWLGTINAFT
jgi:hypothetical protein